MGHVGRFLLDLSQSRGAMLKRGQPVVVQTDRGVELGEVLLTPGGSTQPGDRDHAAGSWRREGGPGSTPLADAGLNHEPGSPRLLRAAAPEDLENARQSQALRAERFLLCERILGDGDRAIDLIDVEPLLDQNTTVLHVLGDLHSNMAALRAEFRSRSGFDVLFEPAGSAPVLVQGDASGPEHGLPTEEPVRRCGNCDCHDGGCAVAVRGGKATAAASTPKSERSSSCGVSPSHSGCASCGVSKWLGDKQRIHK
jgi:hypothetical protein